MRRIILALMAGAATIASPAVAATTVDFTASGITTLVGPDAPPVTSANGTFAYDYAGGNALTLTAFSLNIGSAHFGLADVASTFNSLNDALQSAVSPTGESTTSSERPTISPCR